jgi:hypothetical protein
LARLKYVLLAVAFAGVAGALGVFTAACDDDAESDSSAQQSDVAALQQQVDTLKADLQSTEELYAVLTLGTLELHGMDEGLNETGTIESSYVPNTRTAVRVLALTDWSDTLQADADAVHDTAVELLQALEAEDVEAAKAASTELHDSAHEFTDAVWGEIAADLPPDAGGVEEEHEEETPAAGETPSDHADEETPAAEETP